MIFFFYGANSYALRQEVHRLSDAYVSRTGSDFGLERVDGTKVTAQELSAELQTVPFLSTSRLVIVENLGANKVVAGEIERLTTNLPESTVVVFIDTEVDRRTNYFKTLSANAKAVEFVQLSGSKLETWVRQEVTRQSAKISPNATRRLIELVGEDQWRLSSEIGKLANYSEEITPATVEEMVEPAFSDTIFNLVDAMTAGRGGLALKLFQGLILQKTSEIYILTMIQWQLRNLLLAKASGGITPSELTKQTGISPYVATKVVAKRRDFSLDILKVAFAAAVDCEYRIKSGQAPAEAAVEQLIFQISSQAGS